MVASDQVSHQAALPAEIQVVVDSLRLVYRTPSTEKELVRKQSKLARVATGLLGREPFAEVEALKEISFTVRSNEAVGIIGLNGSGKSTLLRVIAGLETPTSGQVLVKSAPVLLGVNAAMLPELTGQQNIHLGCLAMGMSPEKAAASYQQIADLSGLGNALHYPMRTYSSGMSARLKFSISVAANPEILMIDEALATGDATFRARSEKRMTELREQAGCFFLVSHAPKTIEEMCSRAIWLHQGFQILDGPADEVTGAYLAWSAVHAKGDFEQSRKLLRESYENGQTTSIVLR